MNKLLTFLKHGPKRDRSAKATAGRVLVNSLVSTAFVGAGLFAAAQMPTDAVAVPSERGSHAEAADGRPPAKHSPAAVLEKHELGVECWNSEMEPLAKWPGHAVVQFFGGKTVYTGDKALVDPAFNEALASIGYAEHIPAKDLPFAEVIALCK